MNKYKYRNILLFASPQFAGNIDEYFIAHTEKLVLYITMPRFNNKFNVIKLYEKGKIISEEKVISSGNIILYYLFWYFTYLHSLKKYYSGNEKFYVITWQPFFFFAGSLQKLFRQITFVYWIGDYFPPISLAMRLYENVKKYYANRIEYVCYLSDRINKKFNGKIVNTKDKKTISWGIKPIKTINAPRNEFNLCFIGVIKPSQGLELLLETVSQIKTIRLKILGTSTEELYQQYKQLIDKYNIKDRVSFPNKMFYGKEIEKEVRNCAIGIALYDVDKNSATYYADPGKIKTYAQYGLPVIMTPIADVEKYIKKFAAGEIVNQDVAQIRAAILKIKRNYPKYIKGINEFNEYFNYNTYYNSSFIFLEK